MKKPNYTEPAVVWKDEDFNSGVTKNGVANYEGTAKARPQASSCGSKLPREFITFGDTRGLQGGAKGQGWARNPMALCQGVPQAQQ